MALGQICNLHLFFHLPGALKKKHVESQEQLTLTRTRGSGCLEPIRWRWTLRGLLQHYQEEDVCLTLLDEEPGTTQ